MVWQGCSSVEEHLPIMYKTLGLIPNTANKTKQTKTYIRHFVFKNKIFKQVLRLDFMLLFPDPCQDRSY